MFSPRNWTPWLLHCSLTYEPQGGSTTQVRRWHGALPANHVRMQLIFNVDQFISCVLRDWSKYNDDSDYFYFVAATVCLCITKGFGCRSVLIPAGCAVLVHRLCSNMTTLFSYCWLRNPELWLKNGPEANAKPQRERSHFPGYHGNLPAPRYSINPEHRHKSVWYERNKWARPQTKRHTQRGRDIARISTICPHITHKSQNTEQYLIF